MGTTGPAGKRPAAHDELARRALAVSGTSMTTTVRPWMGAALLLLAAETAGGLAALVLVGLALLAVTPGPGHRPEPGADGDRGDGGDGRDGDDDGHDDGGGNGGSPRNRPLPI